MKNLFISLSGALFPGTGHLILGQTIRGLAFFFILTAMFFVGVTLHPDAPEAGGFYGKYGQNVFKEYPSLTPGQPCDGRDLEGPVDAVWRFLFIYAYPFFVGFGNYLMAFFWQGSAFVDRVLPYARGEIPVALKDIGDCFALLAGLLNLLVMMDSYDVACNKDILAELGKVAS